MSPCFFPNPVPFGFDFLRLVGVRHSEPPVSSVLCLFLQVKFFTNVLKIREKSTRVCFLVLDLRGWEGTLVIGADDRI